MGRAPHVASWAAHCGLAHRRLRCVPFCALGTMRENGSIAWRSASTMLAALFGPPCSPCPLSRDACVEAPLPPDTSCCHSELAVPGRAARDQGTRTSRLCSLACWQDSRVLLLADQRTRLEPKVQANRPLERARPGSRHPRPTTTSVRSRTVCGAARSSPSRIRVPRRFA